MSTRAHGCRHKGAGTQAGAQGAGTRVQAHMHGAQGTGTDTSNSENKG
jgi:hypothetical protein